MYIYIYRFYFNNNNIELCIIIIASLDLIEYSRFITDSQMNAKPQPTFRYFFPGFGS